MIYSNPDTIKEKYKNNKVIFNNEENINNQNKSINSNYKLKYADNNYNAFYFNPSIKENYFYFFNNLSDSKRNSYIKIDKNNTNIKNKILLPNKQQNVLDFNNNYFTVFNSYYNKNLKTK